jgi:hypothetical protein
LVVQAQPSTARLGNRREVLAMVEQRQVRRPGRFLGGVRPTGEDHRPTTFELFFDLVYVFAATQVTGYMAHEHSGHGVVQGLLLLALLWWTWSAYAWLGNQARADEGVLRATGGCTARRTGPNDRACSSSWPLVNRWSRSGWAPRSSPSAGRCCWRPSWA